MNYSTKQETASLIQEMKKNISKYGKENTTTLLMLQAIKELQRLEGEAKVLRDLLGEADDVITEDLENAFNIAEQEALQRLKKEIEAALRGAM